MSLNLTLVFDLRLDHEQKGAGVLGGSEEWCFLVVNFRKSARRSAAGAFGTISGMIKNPDLLVLARIGLVTAAGGEARHGVRQIDLDIPTLQAIHEDALRADGEQSDSFREKDAFASAPPPIGPFVNNLHIHGRPLLVSIRRPAEKKPGRRSEDDIYTAQFKCWWGEKECHWAATEDGTHIR